MATVLPCDQGRYILTSGLGIGVWSSENGSFEETTMVNPLPRRDVTEVPQPAKENLRILCSAASRCGQFVAFADDHKQLTVWSMKDKPSLVKQWNLVRRANKVLFDKSGLKVLIADKSGDVFQFDVKSEDTEGKCLLGHLSMLLDLKLSNCGKFIISSDRDEKIRISHYPNCYNIHNFCLGHEDFVTTIEFLPKNDKYLMSGSGDGTIRIWDYLNGKEMFQCLCAKDAGLEPLKIANDENKHDNDPKVKRMPWPAVLAIRISNQDDDKAVIAVTLEAWNGILVYTSTEKDLLQYCRSIKVDGPIWDYQFNQHNTLVTVQAVPDQYLVFIDIDKESQEVKSIATNQATFFQDAMKTPNASNAFVEELHKRWFDNVKDYLERKRERVDKPSSDKATKKLKKEM